eukprot:5202873-Prymnesium_polylepis.2
MAATTTTANAVRPRRGRAVGRNACRGRAGWRSAARLVLVRKAQEARQLCGQSERQHRRLCSEGRTTGGALRCGVGQRLRGGAGGGGRG